MRNISFIVTLTMFFVSAVGYAGDKEIIDYRQSLMKSLGKDAKALAPIMRGKTTYDGAIVSKHLNSIANIANKAQLAFAAAVPGKAQGEASPEIWNNWEDFKSRFAALEVEAQKVADLSNSRTKAEIVPQMGKLFVCKSCHDLYRIE